MLLKNERNGAKKLSRKAAIWLALIAMVVSLLGAGTIFGAAGDTPAHSKTLTPNGDGTHQLELSVTGEADTTQVKAKANILVIYDTSSSMTRNRTGSGANSPRRADAAEKVVYDFANQLYSIRNAEVNMSLVTFDHTARVVQNWTTDKNTFLSNLSDTGNNNTAKLSYTSGTNYQAGMETGQGRINALTNSDPTFVIFITDGLPSQMDGDSSNTYYNEPEQHEQVLARARIAMGPAREMEERANTTFYGIYAYGDGRDYLDDVVYYAKTGNHRNPENTDIVTTGISDYYFNATATSELEAAIAAIFKDIVQTLGIEEVSITDGTTSSVETTSGTISKLLEVD